MSYQTVQRKVAARVSELLIELGIDCFMAHEHIQVSAQWRLEILRQIRKADIFVALLSKRYYESAWCIQESGIAAFRKMAIVPLSLDGSIPPGFLAHIQSVRIDPREPNIRDVAPGVAEHDESFLIDALIKRVGNSNSYRQAESRFVTLRPFLEGASKDQIVKLLKLSAMNNQVHHAGDCARDYLPPLIKSHGRYLPKKTRAELSEIVSRYART